MLPTLKNLQAWSKEQANLGGNSAGEQTEPGSDGWKVFVSSQACSEPSKGYSPLRGNPSQPVGEVLRGAQQNGSS